MSSFRFVSQSAPVRLLTEAAPIRIRVTGAQGVAGPAGPNSVTSATTSDGTANLSVSNLTAATATVTGTLNANHIHGNLAGSVYAHVRAGENLAKGDPVYISGSHGSGANLIAIVSKADASDPLKMPAVGVMDAAVSNNANGHMVITGTITELDTDDYAVNAELYVASGGGFTATPPTTLCQPVARVERSNQNNGAVIVKVNGLSTSNGYDYPKNLLRTDSTGQLTVGNLLVKTASTLAFVEVTSDSYPDHAAALAINGAGTTYLYLGTSASAGGQIFAQNLTDFRDYQLPNASGTLALTSDLPTLGTNVATFLAMPTSANLAAAVTGETGTGSLVFGTSPTLTTPTISGIVAITYSDNAFANGLTVRNTNTGTNSLTGITIQNSAGTNVGYMQYCPTNFTNAGLQNTVIFGSIGQQRVGFVANAGGSVGQDVYFKNHSQQSIATIFCQGSTLNVGIGTETPNSRAILDVASTTKGFLPPRMTTAQRDAISSPPAGLMVYNTTTNKGNRYNGTAWVEETEGVDSNVAAFLATPTSAKLAAAVTDETGSGSLVFGTSPTITTPTIAQINTPSSTTTLLVTGGGTNGLFGLRSTLSTGYSSLELLNSSGTQMGGFGYANASAGAYADQVYFYSSNKALILASTAGQRHVFLSTTGDVSIGSGAAANTKAVLDLTSTTKGFLPPRMTTTQRNAIASPPAGLAVYNTTTATPNFHNGTAWRDGSVTELTSSDGTADLSVLYLQAGEAVQANAVTANSAYLGAITGFDPSDTPVFPNGIAYTDGLPCYPPVEGGDLITSNTIDANVKTFLETPTSANLAAAVTDETGSGSLVFANAPTFTGGLQFSSSAVGATSRTNLGFISAYKTTNEARSSSTLAYDTDLQITLKANTNYVIECLLDSTVASGGTLTQNFVYSGTLSVGGEGSSTAGFFGVTRLTWSSASTQSVPIISMALASATTPRTILHKLTLRTNTTGTFAVQWSNAAGTGTTTINARSYLTAYEV